MTWSPKLCLFEKCTNTKKLMDKRFDIYERAVTYDGEEFQTRTEPLKGTNLPDRIEKIGMSIASHISNITLEKIKIVRMILNFKITKSDKIIFLWCSSLRIENGLDKKRIDSNVKIKECDMTKIAIRTPDNINIFKYNISGKPIKPHKDAICLNCDQNVESYRLYEISFKTLIESHENRKRDKQFYPIYDKINMTSTGVEIIPYMENKNDNVVEKLRKKNYRNFIIPKVISEIYPKMKYEDYFNLKKDSIFCAKTAGVCDSCFLDITRYCTMGGTNMENILRTMKPGQAVKLPSLGEKSGSTGDFFSQFEMSPSTKADTCYSNGFHTGKHSNQQLYKNSNGGFNSRRAQSGISNRNFNYSGRKTPNVTPNSTNYLMWKTSGHRNIKSGIVNHNKSDYGFQSQRGTTGFITPSNNYGRK